MTQVTASKIYLLSISIWTLPSNESLHIHLSSPSLPITCPHHQLTRHITAQGPQPHGSVMCQWIMQTWQEYDLDWAFVVANYLFCVLKRPVELSCISIIFRWQVKTILLFSGFNEWYVFVLFKKFLLCHCLLLLIGKCFTAGPAIMQLPAVSLESGACFVACFNC